MNDTSLQTDPTLGDGDDPPEDEFELEFEPEEKSDYPWTKDPEEMLRSFIFQTVVDADYAMEPQLALMDACYEWIKHKKLPKKSKLQAVPKES